MFKRLDRSGIVNSFDKSLSLIDLGLPNSLSILLQVVIIRVIVYTLTLVRQYLGSSTGVKASKKTLPNISAKLLPYDPKFFECFV